ncbi:MAG: hypothetical protein EBU98_05335, partial [Actinobacteria bacterium]|nr:hypothetical protein [Actinomycetota bacterium]
MAMILEMTVRLYGHVLGDDLAAEMRRAVRRAVLSEPAARISGRYSNIILLQAWLQDMFGEVTPTGTGDATAHTAPANRWLNDVAEQLQHDGDLAEYNSPTYDAISLLAGCLLLEHARSSAAQRALREVLKHQYPNDVDPRWAGTFKTHAAQPDAGTLDADGKPRVREWRDYDPNWRQFMAMILEMTVRLYGHVLGDDL